MRHVNPWNDLPTHRRGQQHGVHEAPRPSVLVPTTCSTHQQLRFFIRYTELQQNHRISHSSGPGLSDLCTPHLTLGRVVVMLLTHMPCVHHSTYLQLQCPAPYTHLHTHTEGHRQPCKKRGRGVPDANGPGTGAWATGFASPLEKRCSMSHAPHSACTGLHAHLTAPAML